MNRESMTLPKYETHKMVPAYCDQQLRDRIDAYAKESDLPKGEFLARLIEAGLDNIPPICEKCEEKQKHFNEVELLRMRTRALEERVKNLESKST